MENYEKEFWDIIEQSRVLSAVLNRSEELQIPNWYFGAGCLAQTVWNLKLGNSESDFINDIDWVYFDPNDLTKESEVRTEMLVKSYFKDIPLRFDVKNQARVHVWYKEKFGYDIYPYPSILAAIDTWPTTATAIALTKGMNMQKVYAPYGLEDLMSLTVKPNKKQITEEIYLSKVERWKKSWPSLTIIPWNHNE